MQASSTCCGCSPVHCCGLPSGPIHHSSSRLNKRRCFAKNRRLGASQRYMSTSVLYARLSFLWRMTTLSAGALRSGIQIARRRRPVEGINIHSAAGGYAGCKLARARVQFASDVSRWHLVAIGTAPPANGTHLIDARSSCSANRGSIMLQLAGETAPGARGLLDAGRNGCRIIKRPLLFTEGLKQAVRLGTRPQG